MKHQRAIELLEFHADRIHKANAIQTTDPAEMKRHAAAAAELFEAARVLRRVDQKGGA